VGSIQCTVQYCSSLKKSKNKMHTTGLSVELIYCTHLLKMTRITVVLAVIQENVSFQKGLAKETFFPVEIKVYLHCFTHTQC
jgi:hypothetical protein